MTKAVERSMDKASEVKEFDIQKMSQYSIDGRAAVAFTPRKVATKYFA